MCVVLSVCLSVYVCAVCASICEHYMWSVSIVRVFFGIFLLGFYLICKCFSFHLYTLFLCPYGRIYDCNICHIFHEFFICYLTMDALAFFKMFILTNLFLYLYFVSFLLPSIITIHLFTSFCCFFVLFFL